MSMKVLLAVAAGGSIGAVSRYLAVVLVTRLAGHGFPWGTLVVNIAGSLMMGLVAGGLAFRFEVSPEIRILIVVGFLGSFTTFSTFSLDLVTLAERGAWTPAVLYLAGSVTIGALAFLGGLRLWRVIA